MLKNKFLVLAFLILGFTFATKSILADSPGPNHARFFFVDPDNYAAAGAVLVLQKDNQSGTITDITLDRSLVTLKTGNYYFGKLAPNCSGFLEFDFPPSNTFYSYDLRWVTENNLYPSNPQITSTNFFKLSENFLIQNYPNSILYANMQVDAYDFDGNGIVTAAEREQARYWQNQNCGPGSVYYYGPGASPTPISVISPSPTPVLPTLVPTATPTLIQPTSTPAPTTMEAVGFVSPGSINLTIPAGSSQFAYQLTSVSASQFSLGYPTTYGPGINSSPSSGGISPGQSTNVTIQVNSNITPGLYSGFQRVSAGPTYPYALIPFTINVVSPVIPTPTPTFVLPTPTPIPALSFSNVFTTNLNPTSATINWTTNLVSTTQVKYGTISTKLSSSTPENSLSSYSHVQTLAGLSRGKTYYYQIFSRDYTGLQKTDGKTYFFSTPNK